MSLFSSSLSSSSMPSTTVVATTTALATVGFLVLARAVLYPVMPKVLPNPLRTGRVAVTDSKLDSDAAKPGDKDLVYRPDIMPGARDVETPYGTIRVYEYGPETGDKVLLVHGISTPCVTLMPIANELADRGYRVMLFDLFGRGFSDGVSDLPHDARLYVSQILLVLASSPLAWTGDGALNLVGYSLGGGIAIHFANAFPRLVKNLVLLAPAGLIRAESFGRITRFLFTSGLVPERILAHATRSRLQKPIASGRTARPPVAAVAAEAAEAAAGATVAVQVATAEIAANPATPARDSAVGPLEERVMDYVRWMVVHHLGFVPAFMSSIRHAPLTDQHAAWARLAERAPGTTAILLGESDEIIDREDYRRDALPLVGGEERVRWRVLGGSHDFVMTHTSQIIGEIEDMWTPEA